MTHNASDSAGSPQARSVLSPDVIAAVFLLLVCAVLWNASFDIREPDYGQLSPATWPRIIIGALTLLSLIFLLQSIRRPPDNDVTEIRQTASSTVADTPFARLHNFYRYWRNVVWCFALFGLYLYSLPWLGMLIGALLFVFLLLNSLGGWQPHRLLLHAFIAVATVGGMWSLFTFGLGVILPSSSLFLGL